MEKIHDLEKALASLQATYQIALKKIEELCVDKQEMRQEIFKLKNNDYVIFDADINYYIGKRDI